ncbi:hypothetical protein UMZ34_11810 [Halopseudomonas pachastrellae]|nr:hypothetical protein UMZ34_11810 [Halopseudomonas pachastrellae]
MSTIAPLLDHFAGRASQVLIADSRCAIWCTHAISAAHPAGTDWPDLGEPLEFRDVSLYQLNP